MQMYQWLFMLMFRVVQCEEKELTLTKIDVLSTLNYDYYVIPRVRWGELNQASGYRSSEKLFKYKNVQTGLGKMKIPVEDFSQLKDLSESEFLSVLKTKQRIDTEDDTLLGLELLEEGEFDDALDILQNVLITIEKDLGKSHVLYGNALADIGYAHYVTKHYETAMEYYTKATKADSLHIDQYGARNYAASANMLAICAMRAGKKNVVAVSSVLEKAFDSLLKASDLERYKILLNLSNIYLSAWMPIRAIAMLKLARHVLKKNGSDLVNDVYVYLGTAYVMREEYHQAKKLLTLAKTGFEKKNKRYLQNSFYIECLYQLAYLEFLSGDTEEAYQQLSVVKELYEAVNNDINTPQKGLIICTMGQALRKMGETEKAIMFMESASSIALSDASAKTGLIDLRISAQLAELYQELGQLEKLKPLLQSTMDMADHLLGKQDEMAQYFKSTFHSTLSSS